jgi:hypothetical protein
MLGSKALTYLPKSSSAGHTCRSLILDELADA